MATVNVAGLPAPIDVSAANWQLTGRASPLYGLVATKENPEKRSRAALKQRCSAHCRKNQRDFPLTVTPAWTFADLYQDVRLCCLGTDRRSACAATVEAASTGGLRNLHLMQVR
jgi:hypothetical protein